MRNTPLHREIERLVNDRTTPDPEPIENQRFPELLTVENPEFEALVENLYFYSKPKDYRAAERHLSYLRQVLMNLGRGLLTRQWTIFLGQTAAYSSGELMHYLGFTSFRAMQRVLEFLCNENIIEWIPGKKYEKQGQGNKYWPGPALQKELMLVGLNTISKASFANGLVRLNNPRPPWDIKKLPEDARQKEEMLLINDFVQDHHWACKSPIHLVYSGDFHEGGRLHTAFQNLPARYYKIRINTEIDDEPICEVDFNANHLRILLALHGKDVAGGADAYAPLAEKAGLARAKVKGFLSVALNCESFNRARHAARESRAALTAHECHRVTEAFEKIYPGVSLFHDSVSYGSVAQNIEGEIMMHVMLTGMKDNVMTLPIHDAVAVSQRHSEWAEGAMVAAWEYVARHWHTKAKASVKVNWPSSS
jgi:hypothetical protein